jgi:DNA-binding response OmpR family regulator
MGRVSSHEATDVLGGRQPAMAHILIVEDDFPLRRDLTMRFVRQGHSVAEANSVATAREALLAFTAPFDVILLDINLPDGSGWDVLCSRDQAPGMSHARVIAVTAMTAMHPTARQHHALQPAAILLKPFHPTTLLWLIDRQLARLEEAMPCDTATQPDQERGRPQGQSEDLPGSQRAGQRDRDHMRMRAWSGYCCATSTCASPAAQSPHRARPARGVLA